MREDKDIREEILNNEYSAWVEQSGIASIYPNSFPQAYKEAAINAMDERARRMCMDLLQWMAENNVRCDDGKYDGNRNLRFKKFRYKGEWITKEELFSNFL